MKKILLLALFSVALFGKLQVVTTYEYIASLTAEIGGEKVDVLSLSQPNFDPHLIVPRPSLISKVRRADLLIKNGGELEDAWLFPLQRKAGNRKVIIGGVGYLDLSRKLKLINIPLSVSRRNGDVHASGNPHFHLSPENIEILASAISDKLIEIDSSNRDFYSKNLTNFLDKWRVFTNEMKSKMERFKGEKVITYHRLYDYFLKYFEIELLSTLEPIPGIVPSIGDVSNTIELVNIEKPLLVLQDVYHSPKYAQYLFEKTGVKYFIAPHDVLAQDDISDIFALFNSLVNIFGEAKK
jgi:zinc/manganese transport system substrate-binding protein